MLQLIMTRWLPACGKTFWSKEQVKSWWFKRVNKDDLREMIDCWKRSKKNEKNILNIRDHIIYSTLANWTGIIVDDTNFSPIHEESLKKLAEECWAKFVIKEFDIPLEICIERDSKREKPVGRKVIEEMYYKYIYKQREEKKPVKWLQDCVIVDVDWTLAIKGDRNIYDDTKVNLDTVVKQTKELVNSLYKDKHIVVMSWRMDRCKTQTEKWLQDNWILYHEIHMRKTDDTRKDSVVKEELYREYIENKYNVYCVIDDRPLVVKMRRNLWLFVFEVNQPNIDF